jgi:hypothetical protein
MAKLQEEIWKDVIGFEGRYMVSSFGNVKSIPKPKSRGNMGGSFPIIILKPMTNHGYQVLHLSRLMPDKTYLIKTMKIHRLVAEAFIQNPENKPQVNHIDANKQNNNVDNLEWVTHKENSHHARDLGIYRQKAVIQMDMHNNVIAQFPSIIEASRVTGATRLSIRKCIHGEYRHAKGFAWAWLSSATV